MARSMVLYLMLLHRQTVFRPRTAGCSDSWESSIPPALNIPCRWRLPDLRPRPWLRRGHARWRQPEFGQRTRERKRAAGGPLLADLGTLHAFYRSRMRAVRAWNFAAERALATLLHVGL